ncbi:YopX family protein [Streptococcus sanguinis]|nr:MAG TPA: YopX protein [Caudoviricetes sp.]
MIPNFRAWLKKEKEMIDVDEIHWDRGKFEFIGDGITFQRLANEVELMQSTGLKDKNGKEIFEGDIIKVTNENSWLEVVSYEKEKSMFVIKEINRNFKVPSSPLYDLFNTTIFESEIVGNIYENPELIK